MKDRTACRPHRVDVSHSLERCERFQKGVREKPIAIEHLADFDGVEQRSVRFCALNHAFTPSVGTSMIVSA